MTRGVTRITETSHDISTLNRLIASTFDRVEGYAAAADDTRIGRLGALFRARAYEHGIVARSFQVQRSRLSASRRRAAPSTVARTASS